MVVLGPIFFLGPTWTGLRTVSQNHTVFFYSLSHEECVSFVCFTVLVSTRMAYELVSHARSIGIDQVIVSQMASIICSGGEEARHKKLPARMSFSKCSIGIHLYCA